MGWVREFSSCNFNLIGQLSVDCIYNYIKYVKISAKYRTVQNSIKKMTFLCSVYQRSGMCESVLLCTAAARAACRAWAWAGTGMRERTRVSSNVIPSAPVYLATRAIAAALIYTYQTITYEVYAIHTSNLRKIIY